MKPKLYITRDYADTTVNGMDRMKYLNVSYYTRAKTVVYVLISFALGALAGSAYFNYILGKLLGG